MKVQGIEIKNFKGISELAISPNGKNVYAIAANGKGKTSFIDAVFKPLTGKDMPGMPTKKGTRAGAIRIDLGDIVVESAFDAKKEKMSLTVSAPEGGAYASPRAMLDRLVGVVDFDIAGFMGLTARKQVEKLKEILGLDLSDLDTEYKTKFEERAESNRDVKYLEAQCKPYDINATQIVDLAPLEAKRMALSVTNVTRKGKVADEARLATEIAEGSKELERLRAQVDALDATLTRKANEHMDIEAWLDDNQHTPDDEVVAAIEKAKQHNVAVEENRRGVQATQNLKDEKARNEMLTNDLKSIEERKAERIAAVAMPVPGLTFTEDGLFLNGLPFEDGQINTASKIVAGLQLCSAMHKDVHIARFDGSLLDNASLGAVEQWAEENGIQLFIELVARDSDEGLKIEISE